MAGHRPKKRTSTRGQAHVFQDSPFLRLPGEIRMVIYRAALYSRTPLDLCPYKFITDAETNADVTQRVLKFKNQVKARGRPNRLIVPNFRSQDDLAYIRNEMSTAFLRTCKQVNFEATNVFWRENTFRFSSDFDWLALRRWLLTIGPEATSRLRRLEVAPPEWHNSYHGDILSEPSFSRAVGNVNAHECKNHPKLRMKKIGLPPRPGWTRDKPDIDENFPSVLGLLRDVASLKELRLVVCSEFVFKEIPDPWAVSSGQWRQPTLLQQLTELDLMSVSVVLEKGSQMTGKWNIYLLNQDGVGVVAKKGSFMVKQRTGPPPAQPFLNTVTPASELSEITAEQTWVVEGETHLEGVPGLFEEVSERADVPARGGRVTKRPGQQKQLTRTLKGFGGCRFVQRKGYYCSDCAHELHGHMGWSSTSVCKNCKKNTTFIYKDCIEVRRLARERRMHG